uniref:PHD finger protein 5A n=1 Tax=Cebus imitator TaxID=2715852 RepID=A0A2K5PCX5_CEBIM
MAKQHPDFIFCHKQAGVASERLYEKRDGKCVICDAYYNYGSYQEHCVICGCPGVSDAYYCKECTIQEDRDGCPKILFYECKKYAFKKR